MTPGDERLLTVPEVAERCRVTVDTVRRWLRTKRLKGSLLGGQKVGYRVRESDLERFISGGDASESDHSTHQ